MMVKICGITRREDAEAAVEAGASAIGFVFFRKSPRYAEPELAAELGDGLAVWKVGVFVDETAQSIEAMMRTARLDIAQIYGREAPAGARVWRAFRAQPGDGEGAEAVLLDGPSNGVACDWTKARNAYPKVIIAGGLDATNVEEAIRAAQPWGVDACSRLESAPGIKDHEKMRQFIQAARRTI